MRWLLFLCMEIYAFLNRMMASWPQDIKSTSRENRRYFARLEKRFSAGQAQRIQEELHSLSGSMIFISSETTKNLSEWSLRFAKCKDKISGQFQNEAHARFFANIRTYIEICAHNGANEFQDILRLTQNNLFSLNLFHSAALNKVLPKVVENHSLPISHLWAGPFRF